MPDSPVIDAPAAGTEFETLTGTLERIRRTFAWKCSGLDASAMATTVGASSITMGGLLRHLARCEESSFSWKVHGLPPTGAKSDWDLDWAWTADDDPNVAWDRWLTAVERSRKLVAEAMADGGLERAEGWEFPGWGTPSLRRVLADMIEEYARHVGHADLIRESIDGLVGEDAPEDFAPV
jgi:hypothetical protein